MEQWDGWKFFVDFYVLCLIFSSCSMFCCAWQPSWCFTLREDIFTCWSSWTWVSTCHSGICHRRYCCQYSSAKMAMTLLLQNVYTHCTSTYSLYENRISTSYVLPYAYCKTNWLHCVLSHVIAGIVTIMWVHTHLRTSHTIKLLLTQ